MKAVQPPSNQGVARPSFDAFLTGHRKPKVEQHKNAKPAGFAFYIFCQRHNFSCIDIIISRYVFQSLCPA